VGAIAGLTGGTGHIGGLLLRRLLAEPDVAEVRSVARRPLPPLPGMPVEPVARLVHTVADLRSDDARRALEGCDVVFHLAAQVWRGRQGVQEMAAVNVQGTRSILRGAGAVVLASSAAVYGAWPDNPLPMAELRLPRPNQECPYAQQKLVAEEICAEQAQIFVIARLSAVLGPHADARVTRAVRGYRVAVPAVRGARQAVQWMDEDDAVRGLVEMGRDLLGARAASGQVINLAPEDWLSAADVARLARSRVIALPRRALIWSSELGRRVGISPFGADRAVLVSGPLALSARKAAQLLSWRAAKSSELVMSEALARDWRQSPQNRQL